MIRTATLADVPRIVEIGAELHAESPCWSRLGYEPERVARHMEALIAGGENALVLVAEVDGAIVGGIAAIAQAHWSSFDMVAQEVSFFLQPAHRGGSTAIRLVRWLTRWSYDIGCVMLVAGTSTGIHDERNARFYEALGFKRSIIGLEVWHGN